jgi:DNA-binding CsgD family transcriptional regulator
MPPEARAWLANVAVMDRLWVGDIAQARATADEELAEVETTGDSSGAGLLLAQAAFLAYFSGDFAAARQRAERAVTIARSAGDAEARARAQLVHILARRRLDRSRARSIADLADNAAFAREAGLGVGEANSLFVTAYMTLRHEDFAAAETVGAAAGTWYGSLARVLHCLIHVLEGRPDRAEPLLARAGGEVRHGMPTLGLAVDIAEAHLFLHRGELDHAHRLLDRPPAAPEAALIPMVRSGHAGARGWLAWEEDRLADAAAALAESLASCLAGGGYDILDTGPLMLPLQADTLVRLGRPTEAQEAVDRCSAADVADEPDEPDGAPDRFTAAAVAAARFRLAPSDDTGAAAERAAAAAPWPWLHALVACWRGSLLGDADAATAARDRFASIDSLRGVERADAVLQAVLHRVGRRAAASAGAGSAGGTGVGGGLPELSPRELEVAVLVADGLTNAAIAARLFVSRATVSSHVTHILTKLGFTSRAQIAAWVAARRQWGA